MVPAPQCSGYSLIDRTIHPWTDSQRFSNAPRAESTFLYRWTSLYAEVHRRYIDWPPDLEFARSFVDVAGATRDVRIVAPQRGSRGTPEGAGHTRSTQCNPKSRCIQQMTRAHKIFLHFETPRVNVGLLEHSIVTRSFSNGRIFLCSSSTPTWKPAHFESVLRLAQLLPQHDTMCLHRSIKYCDGRSCAASNAGATLSFAAKRIVRTCQTKKKEKKQAAGVSVT